MSYEGRMLAEYKMPSRNDVEKVLLKTLFKHNGTIKEFGTGEDIVDEIADSFGLSNQQRNIPLERIYKVENRIVKTPLWHRLLYRAAHSLAEKKLVSNPSSTVKLTNKKEWMLTENGFNEALKLLELPIQTKNILPTKSYEVEKIVKKLKEATKPHNYTPFSKEKRTVKTTKQLSIRERGFRHAVIEAYSYQCAVCGLKIKSPDSLTWEVQAAHIVPHHLKGRDDIWNGLSLCHLHHWAFDVGWFTILEDYRIKISNQIDALPSGFGKFDNYDFIKNLDKKNKISLPISEEIHPHQKAIQWHRENIFSH